ncbi:dihydrofolate reductase family protein [Actinoallomurus iriomotensis]|uniref:Dihydrofolate reductase n=1 Tax=Actinoallomurus iriomotensis TaxID=478107 RepID=A0A9W6W3X8_9ACTN|nr:dihydrofolate reductase family protein [Actinoallomurus iriomotensis]GLY88431.1 dihydrofolate reductase [Actinoallomurus iriomotensis]
MRTLFLNMTMSLDGYVAGPNGELDWMTTAHDAELTADIVAQLRRADEGFIGYPTAEPMIHYWASVAQDPKASQASRDIAEAVATMHTFAVSRSPEQLGVPNAEVLVASDDAALTAAVAEIKKRPGRDLGLPGGVRTARTFARLDLIDEYVFLVEPVALGAGQRLFTTHTPLTPVATKSYRCGITRLVYRPIRPATR